MPEQKLNTKAKIFILSASIIITIGFHYGWITEPFFGHIHWLHALHGRFCYIPIVVAASWFGLRGGIFTALAISILVLPYIFKQDLEVHSISGEIVELVFYFAIALVVGALVEREYKIRKKHEQANLQLEKSHRLSMVGQIAAGVAHEIKNPLASIKGSVEILTDEKTNKKDKNEFKQIVFNEIKRIDTTVTNFLELSRPKEFNFEKVDLSSIVDTCIKQIQIHAQKNEIIIDRIIDPKIYIKGDKEKIHQVLLNLLLNAIQASDNNSTIKVQLLNTEDTTTLSITDFGEGMTEETLSKLFDPFYTTKPSGSGLGLSLVKSILDKHDASIVFDSVLCEGTTVSVNFNKYEVNK